MRVKFLTVACTVVSLAACYAAEARAPDELAERIRQVETGLLPLDRAGQDQAPTVLMQRMRHYRVPGVSIAVITQGRLEWARAYGETAAGSGEAVDTATRFQAASVSKSVAAIAALRLVDEGRLALDADVNGQLVSWQLPESEFTRNQKVTLRRILSHSAGLNVHGFPGYSPGERLPTVPQILDGEPPANSPPVRVTAVPGSQHRYSGGGTTILQQLLTDVSGEPFPALMQRLVLEPAQMVHSTFEQPLPSEAAGTAASGHRSNGAIVPGGWQVYPEMAAAGLWTTPSDLARLAIAVQSSLAGAPGSLLSEVTARQALTPHGGDFGLGFLIEGNGGAARFSHTGANSGFRAYLVAYRETGQGAVVMINGEAWALAAEIMYSIARAYGWPDYPGT
jgi:CubicO group peptidase (beta-lactamase class C family)